MTITPQAANSLRVGAASVCITPSVGVVMQGYDMRHAEGISDPLSASALAVGQDSVAWLLVSVDCIGLDRAFTARLRETLARRLLLAPSAITIACSHTHSGPATLQRLGPVASDNTYLAVLEERLAAVAEAAAERLQPARWRFGVTSLAENVNRRLRKNGRIELAPNPNGPVDTRLRVIRIDRDAGSPAESPLALVVHYACHATSSSGIPRVSADWPGLMRTTLQHVYDEGGVPPVICFVQGCTGDVTHRVGRDQESWPQHFGQSTQIQSEIMGRLAGASAICASERSIDFPAAGVQTEVQALDLPFADGSGLEQTEVQVVRIGPPPARHASDSNAVWLIGLPGEPFTSYSTELGRQFCRRFGARPDSVLVCGYTNDCVGYLCTPKALREGGYEAAVAHELYHRPAPFSSATQTLVYDCALTAARRCVRETPRPGSSILAAGLKALTRWGGRRPSPHTGAFR